MCEEVRTLSEEEEALLMPMPMVLVMVMALAPTAVAEASPPLRGAPRRERTLRGAALRVASS